DRKVSDPSFSPLSPIDSYSPEWSRKPWSRLYRFHFRILYLRLVSETTRNLLDNYDSQGRDENGVEILRWQIDKDSGILAVRGQLLRRETLLVGSGSRYSPRRRLTISGDQKWRFCSPNAILGSGRTKLERVS